MDTTSAVIAFYDLQKELDSHEGPVPDELLEKIESLSGQFFSQLAMKPIHWLISQLRKKDSSTDDHIATLELMIDKQAKRSKFDDGQIRDLQDQLIYKTAELEEAKKCLRQNMERFQEENQRLREIIDSLARGTPPATAVVQGATGIISAFGYVPRLHRQRGEETSATASQYDACFYPGWSTDQDKGE